MHGFLLHLFDAIYYHFTISFAVFDQCVCSFRFQLKKIDFLGITVGKSQFPSYLQIKLLLDLHYQQKLQQLKVSADQSNLEAMVLQ